MHVPAAVLVLQAATVIDVQANQTVTLALQFGDTTYTAMPEIQWTRYGWNKNRLG
jgi:hypothetical protein